MVPLYIDVERDEMPLRLTVGEDTSRVVAGDVLAVRTGVPTFIDDGHRRTMDNSRLRAARAPPLHFFESSPYLASSRGSSSSHHVPGRK
jgi:hypothetical protein